VYGLLESAGRSGKVIFLWVLSASNTGICRIPSVPFLKAGHAFSGLQSWFPEQFTQVSTTVDGIIVLKMFHLIIVTLSLSFVKRSAPRPCYACSVLNYYTVLSFLVLHTLKSLIPIIYAKCSAPIPS
jgi:hypothetical protein